MGLKMRSDGSGLRASPASGSCLVFFDAHRTLRNFLPCTLSSCPPTLSTCWFWSRDASVAPLVVSRRDAEVSPGPESYAKPRHASRQSAPCFYFGCFRKRVLQPARQTRPGQRCITFLLRLFLPLLGRVCVKSLPSHCPPASVVCPE